MSEKLIGKNVSDSTLGNVININTNQSTSTIGTLIVASYTTAERDALQGIVNGAIIFNTTTTAFNFYENDTWQAKTNV